MTRTTVLECSGRVPEDVEKRGQWREMIGASPDNRAVKMKHHQQTRNTERVHGKYDQYTSYLEQAVEFGETPLDEVRL